MGTHTPKALLVASLLPAIVAAQSLPCGECDDRLPQLQRSSPFEALPGGDDPRLPASVAAPSGQMPAIPSDDFAIGITISGLRGMNAAQGIRRLVLLDGRRVAMAPFLESCKGSMTGSLSETFGGIEWRITGCSGSEGDDGPFAQLRFEAIRPSDSTPRHLLYARGADGNYRLAEVGEYGEGSNTDAAVGAITALTPAELEALEQRLRDENGVAAPRLPAP